MPAVTQRPVGKGNIYMVAGAFSEEMVLKLMKETNTLTPYRDIISLPKECEIAIRKKDDTEYMFVLN